MQRDSGQSLIEYATIGVLIAVVAIPALAFLGDNVRHKLVAVKPQDPMTMILGPQTAAGPAGATVNGASGTNASAIDNNGIMTGEGWEAKYDAASGQILFAMPGAGGVGTNTASVSGLTQVANFSKTMSEQLKTLAGAADANGNPLPGNLQTKIRQLADAGAAIATQESNLANNVGDNASSLATSVQEFNAAYLAVQDSLAASGMTSTELTEKINAYSGAISYPLSGNSQNYGNTGMVASTEAPVGTAPQQVETLSTSPVIGGASYGSRTTSATGSTGTAGTPRATETMTGAASTTSSHTTSTLSAGGTLTSNTVAASTNSGTTTASASNATLTRTATQSAQTTMTYYDSHTHYSGWTGGNTVRSGNYSSYRAR